ncbi:SGNH/GDSL hydrolase family protein [Pontibacter sp. HSC-36F09]|uniref:SGNH/GDSL hydrolase family protein n=1 Tax=Pontibacter sp. HSC-36F09 TaxID=2910966 RepID=UPI00209CABDA|nr:SGNH/GDSL hydrolase family protein [Pontibacter sp. HSC-36F09]MCP2043122.1 lysophospholipase L1-like esterase [Pontibacter sp. HSC-36F09]
MKKFFYKSSLLALMAGMFLTSCDPEIDVASPSAGTLDFTKYVAVGNSLTAGYQDGGLYREGQLASFPALIAQQLEIVGGGSFVQPLFTEAQANGSGYLKLTGFNPPATPGASPSPILTPVTTNLAVRTDVAPLPGGPRLTKFTDPVNNYAVPGMSVLSSATPIYGGVNPYFDRLLADAEVGSKSYVAKVAESQPTFFTLWLGNNDVLTYATNGAVVNPANPFGDKTPVATFRMIYTQLLGALAKGGETEGVVANIPDVAATPFFTTVTLDAIRKSAGMSDLKVYIRVAEGPTGVRELGEGDLILLTTQAAIGRADQVAPGVTIPHGFHPLNPLTDSEVLDKDEVAEVRAHTQELNKVIAEVAAANKIPVFDVNKFFTDRFARPFVQNGVPYSSAFITGNVFSLDGIHLTPRGNAIVANEFIRVINTNYNTNIPLVDETQYRAVLLP